MKKIYYFIMTVGVFFFAATSCTDVLDQKPLDSFNEESVFSDLVLTKAYLANCYEKMGGDATGVLGFNRKSLGCMTDQLYSTNNQGDMPFTRSLLSPDHQGYFDNSYFGVTRWTKLYPSIKNVNVFLENIDIVPAELASEQALVQRMKGEAYFIRAFSYSQLLRCYGGVILLDKPFTLDQDFLSVHRSSLAETRDFILADLDMAISLLPKKGDDMYEQGRASQGAAAALKSRVLTFCASKLCNGGYEASNPLVSFTEGTRESRLQAARDAAKALLDGTYGSYALTGTTDDPPAVMTEEIIQEYADNYESLFLQTGEWDEESIWGLEYTDEPGVGHQWNRDAGPNGWHCWGALVPTEDGVRKFEMADGSKFVWDAYDPGAGEVARAFTAEELAADPAKSPYGMREPRFYACVLYHGAVFQPRPSEFAEDDPIGKVETGHFYNNDGTVRRYGLDTRQTDVESWNGTKTGYYVRKWLDPDVVGQYFWNQNAYIEFRFAEVLLDYAEACIELGGSDLQNGINALNMVRNRAGLPDRVTSDQVQAREWLQHERSMEYYSEQTHWYDIRRWMTVPENMVDVRHMEIKEYDNGDMEWKLNMNTTEDTRTFVEKNYWLPIIRSEMNKAPQLEQNPNY
ncbi:RagB/SusD family nutrient uptake outer membrane protein [Sunxiuqinia sp. A32]|uniref:RagB/SusD family nutrient uptake outer membrane protein n=1 Tax=Sunxiuqinia sp. A32 TaxID=3461496 RepID=UPI004045E0E8